MTSDTLRRRMRRIFALALLTALAAACLVLTSCNKNDNTYRAFCSTPSMTRARIALPNGDQVEGPVTAYAYHSNGSMEVTVRGVTYLTHWTNVVLSAGEEGGR